MSRIRFYFDEDAGQHAVLDALRQRDVDVLSVIDVNRGEESDEDQLQFAAAEGRVLYTLNVAHFCRLHGEFLASGRNHAGIVVIPRQRYSVGEKIRRLLALVETVTAEAMINRLEYL
jgi:hypothetical protein